MGTRGECNRASGIGALTECTARDGRGQMEEPGSERITRSLSRDWRNGNAVENKCDNPAPAGHLPYYPPSHLSRRCQPLPLSLTSTGNVLRIRSPTKCYNILFHETLPATIRIQAQGKLQ